MVPGKIYHVYNRANGWEELFSEWKNFIFFIRRTRIYLRPVARLYAYNLLPNHFHLLVRIRDQAELEDYFELADNDDERIDELLSKKLSKSFSNLFSSYAQAYNKVYGRVGSLFMQNMKVEEIHDVDAFCKVLHFIHANAVLHGFVENLEDWPHSSYASFLHDVPTLLSRDHVLRIFGGRESFIQYHRQPVDMGYKWLDEKGSGKELSNKKEK